MLSIFVSAVPAQPLCRHPDRIIGRLWLGRSLSTEPRLEVLPFGRRSRRNRRSPDEVKVCVVTETLMPGERVANVARQHGVSHA
ncbi:transposase, partial [Paracoccus sp. (in: a-proteobacteria)]|uniref:transposase n=1 Tax=Paracoccus sp. TaxID=267 RepID=UPI0026E08309